MAKNTSTAHVAIVVEGKQAVNMMKILTDQAKSLRDQLAQMEKAGTPDPKKYEKLKSELKTVESAVRQNKTGFIDLAKVVGNLSGTTLKRLQDSLKECRKQMKNLTAGDPRMKVLTAQYKAIDNQIGKITGQFKRQQGAIESVMKRLTAYVGIYGVFNFLRTQMTKLVSENLKFSDTLADIRKVTLFTSPVVQKLSDDIIQLGRSSRTSNEDLHRLAYQGGRLGLAKFGVEGILGFVKAADQLSVALKEDLGDDSIIQLMKMADVMGLIPKMGVEKSLLAIGSSINALINSSTADGQSVVDFSRRLAGVGVQARISSADLLGMASASSSLSLATEVSATAMSKFITQMFEKHELVAQAAGMEAEYLKTLLAQGNATEAMIEVFERLGKLGGLSPLAPLMKDLGSDGARMMVVLSTMAGNSDKLRESIELSRLEFEKATSVTNEYNVKNETAAAVMEKMKKSWDVLFTNQTNVGVIKDFAVALQEMSDSLQRNEFLALQLKGAFILLVGAVKLLIALLPSLITFFSVKYIVTYAAAIWTRLIPSLTALIGSFKATVVAGLSTGRLFTYLMDGIFRSTAAVWAKVKAWWALNTAMKANIIGAVVSVLVGLVLWLTRTKEKVEEVKSATDKLNESYSNYTKEVDKASVKAEILFSRLLNTTKGTKEHEQAVVDINKAYGKYLPTLLTATDETEKYAEAQEAVNQAIRRNIAWTAKQQAKDAIGSKQIDKMSESLSKIRQVYEKLGAEGAGEFDINHITTRTNELIAAGKNVREIAETLRDELYREGGASDEIYKMGNDYLRRDLVWGLEDYAKYAYELSEGMKEIDKKFNPMLKGWQPEEEEDAVIIPDVDIAKAGYKAILDDIDTYFRQQQMKINENHLAGKTTAEQHAKELSELEDNQYKTRISALELLKKRRDTWQETLGGLEIFDIAKTDASAKALNTLMEGKLDEFAETIQTFGGNEMNTLWGMLDSEIIKLQEKHIKAQKKEEKDSNKDKRTKKLLEAARDENDAVMSAIEVFYQQQEKAINDSYIRKQITIEQKEKMLSKVEMELMQTRMSARLALMDKDADNTWGESLAGLPLFDMAKTEESAQAIENLVGKNLQNIGDRLRRFGDGEMDGLWKKYNEDAIKIQNITIKLRSEIERILLEYDFKGKVDRQFRDNLEQLQLFYIDYAKATEEGFKDVEEAADEGMKRLGKIVGALYELDINSDMGQDLFRYHLEQQGIFSKQMINLKEEELKALYYKTIEYGDATTEAEKKARDRQLKIAKERYRQTGADDQFKADDARNKSMIDIYKSAESLGLASSGMVIDQEILMYERRLEAATEYYNYLRTHGYDTEEQMTKLQEAQAELSEKLVDQIKNRLANLKEYTDLMEPLAEKMGESLFADDGLKERQDAFKDTLKSIGEITNKLIMNWVKQKIEHGIIRATMEARERKFAQTTTETQSESMDAQNTIVQEGSGAITDALIGFGEQAVTAKKAQAVENVGTAATETAAEVPLGIAAGAAKTIGQLGWWGIPLVAVISALLGGLLSTAMGKVNSLFGSSSSADTSTTSTSSATKVKLKSGMLTYDRGNVQQYSLGDDGKLYPTTQVDKLSTGLVTSPIATTVGGRAAIIGENGPEMVIGRETTAAMQLSRPDLMEAIVSFDRNHSGRGARRYDQGNVSEFAATDTTAQVMEQLAPMLSQIEATMQQSGGAIAELNARLAAGIYINKYGKGGLMEEVIDGLSDTKRNGSSRKANRIF